MHDIADTAEHLGKLQSELQKLRTATDEIDSARSAARSVIDAGESVLPKLEDLADTTRVTNEQARESFEAIAKVDFPLRLEKLDTTISSINISSQNLATELQDQRRALETVSDQSKKNGVELKNQSDNLSARLQVLETEQATLKKMLVGLLTLVPVMSILAMITYWKLR